MIAVVRLLWEDYGAIVTPGLGRCNAHTGDKQASLYSAAVQGNEAVVRLDGIEMEIGQAIGAVPLAIRRQEQTVVSVLLGHGSGSLAALGSYPEMDRRL